MASLFLGAASVVRQIEVFLFRTARARVTLARMSLASAAINDYIAVHNTRPKPFIWTAEASDILAKVTRARAVLNKNTSI